MEKVILKKEEIEAICKRLAEEIKQDVKDDQRIPLFLGVMKGALPFLHDLIKEIDIPLIVDYIQLKSYDGTESTGKVSLVKDMSYDVTDRTIIVVEDIVDSGISMEYLVDHLKNTYHPKRVMICALFDKTIHRKANVEVKYVGSRLEQDYFLCGYGLDYNEIYRNVPYVFVPTNEEIMQMNKLLKK